jgi:hypothetical protein
MCPGISPPAHRRFHRAQNVECAHSLFVLLTLIRKSDYLDRVHVSDRSLKLASQELLSSLSGETADQNTLNAQL